MADTPALSKTRTVLHRSGSWPNGSRGPRYVPAETVQDGAHSEFRPYQLDLPADVYEDMGRPETITVTIRPGDRLNP